MDITPKIDRDAYVIGSYGDGEFIISNVPYAHSVIVTESSVIPWDIADFSQFDAAMAETLAEAAVAAGVEIMLLGTGEQHEFVAPSISALFSARGVSVDYMNTGAACRTYNILMAEGRTVMTALLVV